MKNKIKHFSKGDFQISRPEIIFPETHLTIKIGEGEVYSGSFTIENENDGEIRGLVYPSSFRMQCKEQGFEGNPVTINYAYDGRGLKPGHVEKGKFAIVCNGGEYTVAFAAIIERPFVVTSYGRIQNLNEFKKLAIKDYDEAKKLFRSRDFYEVIKYEENRIRYLYDNIRKWALDEQGLEEFLVSIKQKERIFLTLDFENREIKNPHGILRESLNIKKNTWGYMETKVYTDGDFLDVSVECFTTDDFVGADYELQYAIRTSELHAGRNMGAIYFETPYEILTYELTVVNEVEIQEDYRDSQYKVATLLKGYLNFCAGKTPPEQWLVKVSEQIRELQVAEPKNEYYKLMQANAYILVHQEEEASWILENFTYNRFGIGRDAELDMYYLYLTALVKREVSQTKKVVEEIQRVYLKHPRSWKMLCMLVQIDSYYKDYYERARAMENQFALGAHSLLFYLEAYHCFGQKEGNLKKLGEFEIQVLNFAAKYGLLSKEIALYTANLASQQKSYDKRIYKILAKAYELYTDPMILTSICTILIKGNQVGDYTFEWYERGIQQEIKLAQLFEYYMASIDPIKVKGPLPRTVHLYFAHGNSLNYKKASLLYANLIQYEDETTDLYACYREEMQIFTMEQLDKRHINDQLRVLYKRFLTSNEMNIEKIKAIYDICFSYNITTNAPNIKSVLVIEDDGVIRQVVPYTERGAQVVLSTKDDRVVFENNNGTFYAGSIKYDTQRLFYDLRFIEMCQGHIERLHPSLEEEEELELTFENLKLYGMDIFEEADVFVMCSKKIREENYQEDDFLTHVCFKLFKKEQYDKILLTYLSMYYCGATFDMKEIWYAARDYEVQTYQLSERIITQMVFSEYVFEEAEIFDDYSRGGAYFRLKQAYIAYISHEYIVSEREIHPVIMQIMGECFYNHEDVADVVQIALLKYYSCHEIPEELMDVLQNCLQYLCEKQIFFSFYKAYKEEWLRELQIWDKTMVEYKSTMGGQVKLTYQLQKENQESLEYETEVLAPMYANIYVKKFVVYKDEVLKYYFKETVDEVSIRGEKHLYRVDPQLENIGKYGRINEIARADEDRMKKMRSYALEEELANYMFVPFD